MNLANMRLHIVPSAKGLVARMVWTLERMRIYLLRVDVPFQSTLRFK
jgi:hypothetical protein